ncbi:MAG: GerMN domain-containing protein [Calothrix sp. C42_A2020_038]|nr:GerMN domain-containing protein [Calothrix sp. C42_A2020_038]
MREQQRNNRISSGVIAAVSAAVVAVSGGVAWITWQANNTNTPVNTPKERINPSNSQTLPGSEQTAEIYLLKDTGTNFQLVPLPVKVSASKDNPNQFLQAAFNSLLTAKNDGDTSSTIPSGTKVLDVKVENDSVRVNLSEEFTSGGGSASMTGRVGQVVYTATSLNPNAKVYIDVNGKQLDVLGGEGLELDQPLTRDSFSKNYQL